MASRRRPITLAVDLGGTWIKHVRFDASGRQLGHPRRTSTPRPATPAAVLGALARVGAAEPGADRVALGFPGVVERGTAHTAANLHPSWVGRPLLPSLTRCFGCPVRVANDADLHGLGVIRGQGTELVITLGTGVGSALFINGVLVPNLELGHHPFERGQTYETLLGDKALLRIGVADWRARLKRAIAQWQDTFRPHRLYLGGGNARLLSRLPRGVRAVRNDAGLRGGLRLWASGRSR